MTRALCYERFFLFFTNLRRVSHKNLPNVNPFVYNAWNAGRDAQVATLFTMLECNEEGVKLQRQVIWNTRNFC